MLKQPAGYGGFGRRVKPRTAPFARIAQQRKLRDGEKPAADLRQRSVHLACLVIENPKRRNFLAEIVYIPLCIAFRHAEQDQQAGPDLPDDLAIHYDRCACHPLNNGFHREGARPGAPGVGGCDGKIPSNRSNRFFTGSPPENPPNDPSPATTRWQGTTKGNGLAPHAAPTARAARGCPSFRATQP